MEEREGEGREGDIEKEVRVYGGKGIGAEKEGEGMRKNREGREEDIEKEVRKKDIGRGREGRGGGREKRTFEEG